MLYGNEAPLKKLVLLNGLSAASFWVSVEWTMTGPGLIIQTILKFICYVSVFLWLNSAFYLKNCAEGVDTETFEFQRELVKLSLWIMGILIVSEIPMMLSGL